MMAGSQGRLACYFPPKLKHPERRYVFRGIESPSFDDQRREAMKRFSRFALVWFAVCFVLAPLRAQEAPKKAPGPAPSPSEAVLEQWNDIGRKLIAMAQDFPEDKYSFKPAPTVGTFAQRMIHAAHANEFFINIVRGEKMPTMADPKPDTFKN